MVRVVLMKLSNPLGLVLEGKNGDSLSLHLGLIRFAKMHGFFSSQLMENLIPIVSLGGQLCTLIVECMENH